MPSCEVQRTLVKSPPELWAELSDPASLARHLGEFGEIRTTRVEPETAVEWEGEAVRGAVQLKASGWGTRVTLTVVREAPAAAAAPESSSEAALVAEPEEAAAPAAIEPETTPEHVAQPQAAEPEPEPEPAASSRRGFFARLFRRRRGEQPSPEAAASEPAAAPSVPPDTLPELTAGPSEPTTAVADPAVVLPEPAAEQAAPTQAAQPQPQIEDRPDLAAELAQVEAAMLEQDTALLTAVLDRLGAAHHRPFSRG